MFLLLFTLFTLALFSSLHASPLVHRRSALPSGWSLLRRHHPSAILPLRFGLAQSNIHNIEVLLLDVSDPASPNYGKHWSPSRVADTFKPADDTIRAVRDWLISAGFDPNRIRLSHQRTWIEINATVQEAEQLLHAEYNLYQHHSGAKHVACDHYHLPNDIVPHVDVVTPTVDFNAILTKRDNAGVGHRIGQPGFPTGPKKGPKLSSMVQDIDTSTCSEYTTLNCLRALYGIAYKFRVPTQNSFAIVEYTPQAYLASDLDMFSATYEPTLVGKRPKLASIDGGVVQTSDTGFSYNGESNLDFQYAMGLVGPAQPVTLYQVGDLVEGASFNNLLDALDGSYCTFEGGDDPNQDGIYPDTAPGGYDAGPDCGTFKPAYVISTSYGYNEADLTPAYENRQCAEYAKLGLMGVTVLYSSGDNGVAGNGGLCLNPGGTQSTTGTIFNPTFPSTCPYVTSVGATQVNPGSTVAQPESACEQVIYSSGGFSNVFKMPGYQKIAIANWKRNGGVPSYSKATYNSTLGSRGFPDLAANGANYVVAIDGVFELVYGTSASTPVVASMFAMVNDDRIAAGKQPIGFINPTIYGAEFQGAFHDITSGNNPGCGTQGFEAVTGWDPVTGLGTPNFPVLLSKFVALP